MARTSAERKRQQRENEAVDWLTYWSPQNLHREHRERGRNGFDPTLDRRHQHRFTREEARHVVGVPFYAESLRFLGPAKAWDSADWRQRAQVRIDIERERKRMLDVTIERELDRIGAAAQEAQAASSEVQARVARLRELLHERYRSELADELEELLTQ